MIGLGGTCRTVSWGAQFANNVRHGAAEAVIEVTLLDGDVDAGIAQFDDSLGCALRVMVMARRFGRSGHEAGGGAGSRFLVDGRPTSLLNV